MTAIKLTDQSIIEISGPDAETFLQGQLTCDVRKVTTAQKSPGALCNAQGRVLATFYLSRNQDIFYMQLATDLADKILTVLKKYAHFSKVTLKKSESPVENKEFATLNDWHLSMIRAGIAMIYAQTSGLFTPHDLAYPQQGGVSFDKGCYTGQEIIARMHYRGKLKQHLYHVRWQGNKHYQPGEKFNLITDAIIINCAHTEEQYFYEALIHAPDTAIAALTPQDNVIVLQNFT